MPMPMVRSPIMLKAEFERFAATMSFPNIHKALFLNALESFTATTDFTEFLITHVSQNIRDAPSVAEMNEMMKNIARELGTINVQNGSNSLKIKNGGSAVVRPPMSDGEIGFYTLLYMCVNLVALRRRPIYAVFYIALLIFWFWSFTIFYIQPTDRRGHHPDYDSSRFISTRLIPGAAVFGGPIGGFIVKSVFNCLRILIFGESDADTEARESREYRMQHFADDYRRALRESRSHPD
jgi:hypothetical protein